MPYEARAPTQVISHSPHNSALFFNFFKFLIKSYSSPKLKEVFRLLNILSKESIYPLNCHFKSCLSGSIWITPFFNSKFLLSISSFFPSSCSLTPIVTPTPMWDSWILDKFIYRFTHLWVSNQNLNIPLNNLIHVTQCQQLNHESFQCAELSLPHNL